MTIVVKVGRSQTTIARDAFATLFGASVVAALTDYERTLDEEVIRFTKLVELARKARIPYALFFAPGPVIAQQVKRDRDLLLQGISKGTFALNSRGTVHLGDIELIVKDLIRKQQTLKRLDPSLPTNPLVRSLRKSTRTIDDDAQYLVDALGIDRTHLLAEGKKERAFDYLIDCLESHHIYVSQAVRGYMPQAIPKRARFSGVCVRDNKVPFIFLNGADGNIASEPAGRRLLTLTLLTVCLARGKFMPLSFGEQTDDVIANREYELAEEILMPAAHLRQLEVDSLEDIRLHADTYCVTPSAFVMRARRLRLIDAPTGHEYMATLREEYRTRAKTPASNPLPVNALRKYNSAEYSRAMLRQMDAGRIAHAEVARLLFQRKFDVGMINDFRAAL